MTGARIAGRGARIKRPILGVLRVLLLALVKVALDPLLVVREFLQGLRIA
jgi:hypothetical protein